MGSLRVEGAWFRDEWGRTLLLRGINVGGASKVPTRPDGATWRREGFYDYREASFAGRPFPAEEADEHFGRLRRVGFTLIRLVMTWEAIEGRAPGVYDEDYLEHLLQILDRAHRHGLQVLLDPHQDAWSRWTGGDGAPAWTLEKVGFDLQALHETGAAFLHQEHGDPYPTMLWPANRNKLAAATLFTLFFGGHVFAPGWEADGEPVQDFLQGHYIRAMAHAASRLGRHPAVVGFGSMNEPTPGWIGRRDLNGIGEDPTRIGPCPTPLQSLALGEGLPQRVETWSVGPCGFRRDGWMTLNPSGIRAWRASLPCRWREQGLWDVRHGAPVLASPAYFSRVGPRPVRFSRDFLAPFFEAFVRAVRVQAPDRLLFLEGIPGGERPVWDPRWGGIVHSPHWYDGLTLLTKSYRSWLAADWETARPVIGPRRVRRSIRDQLARQAWASSAPDHPVPTLIGEFGLPFDLDGGRAYRTGDYGAHVRALTAYYDGLDANFLSAVLWNYTPDNTNARGDGWNGEDLSIFSRDQQTDAADPDAGLRALAGYCRPYPRATAGDPLHFHYDAKSRRVEYTFRPDPAIEAPTEVLLPIPLYPSAPPVAVDGGEGWWAPGTLQVRPAPGVPRVRVRCG